MRVTRSKQVRVRSKLTHELLDHIEKKKKKQSSGEILVVYRATSVTQNILVSEN